MRERFYKRWGRRIISISVLLLTFIITLALLPLLIPTLVVIDLVRQSKWAAMRSLAFLLVYLTSEIIGVTIYMFMLLFSGVFFGFGKERMERWVYALQRWWGSALFYGTVKIYGMSFDIDEPEGLAKGPLMLFIRHAALPDTSLPGFLFTLRHKMRMRHIIKNELRWDPCLDIGASRVPNHFVKRGMTDNNSEIDAISNLVKGLKEEKDGIMIFPEGTRFTQSKRKRILERLAEKGDAYFLEKARALKNVLPPRLGGSLAMLQANTKSYAVFCAHVGFDAATKALNMLNGSLINRTIRIKLWKVPFDKIPKTTEAQVEWLYEQWARVDEWIENHKHLVPEIAKTPPIKKQRKSKAVAMY